MPQELNKTGSNRVGMKEKGPYAAIRKREKIVHILTDTGA